MTTLPATTSIEGNGTKIENMKIGYTYSGIVTAGPNIGRAAFGTSSSQPALRRLPPYPDLDRGFTQRLGAARLHGVETRLAAWGGLRLPQGVQALLTGVVIVADWIASNDELFPYDVGELGGYDATKRLANAWQVLDLPAPWRAVESTDLAEDLFTARFVLPAGARVRPVQKAAVELARSMSEPGLLLIEAPMGEGETEAALATVEVFAARWGAGGCFVALPTRATSDAMFGRVLSWLGRVPDADPLRGALGVMLAHGKAGMNEQLTSLLRWGRSVQVGIDDGQNRQELAAHCGQGRGDRRGPCIRRLHEQVSRPGAGMAWLLRRPGHRLVGNVAGGAA